MSIIERVEQSYWFQNNSKRNIVVTLIASLLFFSAWWIIIDTACLYPGSLNFSYYICGILGTISFIMVNAVSNDMLNGGGMHSGALNASGIKVFLFIGFVLGFTSIIAAIWIMIAGFTVNESRPDKYPGYVLLIHNVFIFSSMIIYKFGWHSENDYLQPY